MHGALLLLAAITPGIDAGWQPLPGGGMEYIIQIEPHALESLAAGREIISDVPSSLGGIKSYRIRVGSGPLPHEEPPASAEPPAPAPGQSRPERGGDPGSAPQGHVEAPGPSLPAWPPPRSANDLTPPEPLDAAPRPLRPAEETTAVPERLAVYNQPEVPSGGGAPVPGDGPQDHAAGKPWMPLTLAVAAFFGAFGGMLYTGWIAWDYRRRYRAILEQMLGAGPQPAPAIDAPESPAD